MESVFAEQTPPETLITDNGKCYTGKEFKEFVKDWNIKHITSSPHYHEGNGLAEKYVNIIKNQLKKVKDAKEDPLQIHVDLPDYTTQQYSTITIGTAQTYTDLPISNLRRSIIHGHIHNNINLKNQCKSDPKVQIKQPAPLPKGTPVMIHDMINKEWFPGTIQSPRAEPNSYDVTSDMGVNYRHSHQHLKPYLPTLPNLEENDNELQNGEIQSPPTSEVRPHHTKKPVHRYIEEM